jgi:hypothetical protein
MNPFQALSTIDLFQRHWQQGNHQMLAGLDCLMGAIGVSISTDKLTYRVGESPIYRISGGVPGGSIAWTSFKNGNSTDEFQSYYGQNLNDAGTASLQGGAWSSSDIGDWQKQILIIPPGYSGDYNSLATGQVSFTVVGAGAQTGAKPGTVASKESGFLDSKVKLPVVGEVPVIAVAGVGIAGLFLLMGSGGGKR